MKAGTQPLCPKCDHDRESHDPQLGCLMPWCYCERSSARWDIRNFLTWGAKSSIAATIAGILMAVGILAILATLSACFPWPKEVDPRYNGPSMTPPPSLQTARQE